MNSLNPLISAVTLRVASNREVAEKLLQLAEDLGQISSLQELWQRSDDGSWQIDVPLAFQALFGSIGPTVYVRNDRDLLGVAVGNYRAAFGERARNAARGALEVHLMSKPKEARSAWNLFQMPGAVLAFVFIEEVKQLVPTPDNA